MRLQNAVQIIISFRSHFSEGNDAAVYCHPLEDHHEGEADAAGVRQSGAHHHRCFDSDANRDQLRHDRTHLSASFNSRVQLAEYFFEAGPEGHKDSPSAVASCAR